MVKMLFTRHGQTRSNVDKTFQSNEDDNLTEKGLEQIEKLAQRLKNEKIDLILSSDSVRCNKTTEGIRRYHNVPVEYLKILREKDNSSFSGKSAKSMNWESLEGTFETRKTPGGESLLEVRERGRKFLRELLKKYSDEDKTILVVSHGAFLKVLIGDITGTDLRDSIFKLFIDNCSLTLIEFKSSYDNGHQIKYINKT